MIIPQKRLRDRIKIMKDEDWTDVEQVACAYVMQNDMDMSAAEALALMVIINNLEAGSRFLH